MQHNMSTWSECLFAFFFGCLLFLVFCANEIKEFCSSKLMFIFFQLFAYYFLKIRLHHSS
jgi:hypothetical protein